MIDAMKRLLAVPEHGEDRARYFEAGRGTLTIVLNVLLILATTATIVLSASTVGWLLGVVILVASYLLGKLK